MHAQQEDFVLSRNSNREEWHSFLATFPHAVLVERLRTLERALGDAFSPPSVDEDPEGGGLRAFWNRDSFYAEIIFELDGMYTSFWKEQSGEQAYGGEVEAADFPLETVQFIKRQLIA